MAYQIEVDFSLYVRQACDNRLAQKFNGSRWLKKKKKNEEADEKKDC